MKLRDLPQTQIPLRAWVIGLSMGLTLWAMLFAIIAWLFGGH